MKHKYLKILSVCLGLFAAWQITACGPIEHGLSEDPAESHGRLDLEAQRRLNNPEKTAQEMEAEIKELQEQIRESERQINIEKLGKDVEATQKDNPPAS